MRRSENMGNTVPSRFNMLLACISGVILALNFTIACLYFGNGNSVEYPQVCIPDGSYYECSLRNGETGYRSCILDGKAWSSCQDIKFPQGTIYKQDPLEIPMAAPPF